MTKPVNVVVPLFTTATGKVPSATSVKRLAGPRNLGFTKDDYRDYKYKVYVDDPDDALDYARIDNVFIPQARWKRTATGWMIPYIKTVAPASPYEYKRLPNVYRSRISVSQKDQNLEEWQVSRADPVSTTFPVTFRK